MEHREIIVGEYTLLLDSELDYSISERRFGSGCYIHEGKRYCRNTHALLDAEESHCVVDFFDGEYMNARKI